MGLAVQQAAHSFGCVQFSQQRRTDVVLAEESDLEGRLSAQVEVCAVIAVHADHISQHIRAAGLLHSSMQLETLLFE